MTNNRSHPIAGASSFISRYLPAVTAMIAAFIPAALFASEAVHADTLDLTTHTVGYLALPFSRLPTSW